jgi:hypothetical protein
MKTKYFLFSKASLKYSLIIFISAMMVSCGSYVSQSYYDRDGIYGSTQTTESTYSNNRAEQNNQYKNYFGSLQSTDDSNQTFTDIESYATTNDTVINYNSESYTNYPGWGSNPTSSTINYYNNNWGWDYYGANWMLGWNWGWNSWYGPNYGWGWNNWYGPNYGWGWYTPYYGSGYYNNYTYNPNRRGSNYDVNNNRYSGRYSENRTNFTGNRQSNYTTGRTIENSTRRAQSTSYDSTIRNNASQRTNNNSQYQNTREYNTPSRATNTNNSPSTTRNDNYSPRNYTPSAAPSRNYGGGNYGGGGGGGRSGGGGGGGRR